MSIPVNTLTWCVVVLPIAGLLVLMMGLHWKGYKAASVALLLVILGAIFVYRANFYTVILEAAKGGWSSLNVLLVIWPAILIYEVTNQAQVMQAFRHGAESFSPNHLLQVLMIGWVFASFLQGITGFGVPVAVAAPLLVALGIKPIYSVVIPLLGQAWGATFGTLAAAWHAMIDQTELAENPALYIQTAVASALLIMLWNAVCGVAICWFYGRGAGVRKGLLFVTVIALVHGGGQLLLSTINPTLACFLPACAAMLIALGLGKCKIYRSEWHLERIINSKQQKADQSEKSLNAALLPYYLLTAMAVLVLLPPPVNQFFSRFRVGFSFPRTSTGYGFVNEGIAIFSPIAPLTHAGLFLILAAAIGYIFYRRKGWIGKTGGSAILRRTVGKALPASITVILLMATSRIMGGTGQTLVLAQGIVNTMGKNYLLITPLIGQLGAFVTSSTMASNILFSQFQKATAELLGAPVWLLLAGQTAGATIGNALAPSNIILGASTAQIPEKEGEILKKILPVAIAAALVMGIIVFAVSSRSAV